MTSLAASEMVKRMIAREMRGPSDLSEAMRRLDRAYGLGYWTLDHLRKGRAKTCEAGLFQKIRAAYLDQCERQLRALQHELAIERTSGNDADTDLLAEVETLLAKVEAKRGG